MPGVSGLSASVDSLRALLLRPADAAALAPATRAAIETAVANAGDAKTVSLQFLDAFDDAAIVAAKLNPSKPKPKVDLTGTGNNGTYQNSILSNLSGGQTVIDRIPNLSLGMSGLDQVQPRSSRAQIDPNSVREGRAEAPPEVKAILASGSPNAAQEIANVLAQKYGRFDAKNTAANRTAILNALNWIADTNQGVAYNTARSNGNDVTTQSPNATLAMRSGVCRDIHSSTAAILGSLMGATKNAQGVMVAGSPQGHEADVQSVGFATASEYHDFMVYKDPATGKWNSLEYSKRYALGADSAVDAMQDTVGDIPGVTRYTMRGWSEKPVVDNHVVLGAETANSNLSADPGEGTKGEIRASASADSASGTVFLSDRVSLTANTGKNANGLTAGVQLNYHRDFEGDNTRGYLRVALGASTEKSEISPATGVRGLDDRVQFQTYVIGAKADARLETKEKELIGQHLKVSAGADADLMLGLPMSSGQGKFVVPIGSAVDYSKAVVGLDGTVGGREQLNKNLTLDWATRVRYQADLVNAGMELATSDLQTAARSLGKDAGRAEIAMALTHTADNGTVTRFEAGGSARLSKPYDAQTTASEEHHAVLTVSPGSGNVEFGIVAQGRTVDRKLVPIDTIGAAVKWNFSKNGDVSVGAKSVFPDGNVRHIGQNVQVLVSGSIKF